METKSSKEHFNPRDQLKKHGWREGSGLGRGEHGIKEAIKVKIKTDTTGIGHDPGEEFTYHWWDHVFNKAANSIQVQTSEDGDVTMKKSGESCISKKTPLAQTLASKKLLYGNFVKAATLTNTGEEVKEEKVEDDSSDDDDTNSKDIGTASKMTDEELFKVCGGRTAHKGARHGLGLSGKLQRVAEQEKIYLQQYLNSTGSSPAVSGDNMEPNTSDIIAKKKRKKDKKKVKNNNNDGQNEMGSIEENTCIVNGLDDDGSSSKKSKKSKKRNRKRVETETCSNDIVVNGMDDIDSGNSKKSKNSKKKKRKYVEMEENCINNVHDCADTSDIIGTDIANNSNTGDGVTKKKHKKRKNREIEVNCNQVEESHIAVDSPESVCDKPKKKKKKKRKHQPE